MFGRWLFVRIRAAERALDEGRIDDAYAAAIQPDIRQHRRGQTLLDDLVRPLTARARLHVQAGRYGNALTELDKLQAVGRLGPEAEELRQRVVEQMRDKQEHRAGRAEAYDRALANLDAGRLESGRLAVEQVDDSRRREALRDQLDIRVQRSAQLLAQAGDALNRGDVLTALGFWQEVCDRHGRSQASDEFAARLGAACRASLDEWFAHGRLERFLGACAGLTALRRFDPTLDECEQSAALCSRCITQLGDRDYAGLRETLLRLRAARGDVGWLDEALAALAKIAEAQDALLASPLGLLASSGGKSGLAVTTRLGPETGPGARGMVGNRPGLIAGPAPLAAEPPDATAASLAHRPLLLLVDGAGSSLLVPQDCVRIGRAGGSRAIDVPIPADIRSHHADIVRDGEDYFLTAYGPARVNRHRVRKALLRDGDRIVLGATAGRAGGKLVFRKPSARSAAAVLTVSHRCRLPEDVSEVILFRDTCLVGPQASCHIRMPEGDTQVVLFERGGRLYGREAASAGGKLGDARPLRLGETFDFGELRMTIKAYEAAGPGGSG